MSAKSNIKSITRGLFNYRLLFTLILFTGWFGAKAQNDYVFYNASYGYLYNDNGTLKSSTSLQFDKSSAWIASGALGTTGRTITSYLNTNLYIRTSANNNGTVSLSSNSSYWQMRNNLLCVRGNSTNYYLRTTNGTSFITSNNTNGAYYPYSVSIYDGVESLSDFTINSGTEIIDQTGDYNYGHSNTHYSPAFTDYFFNNNHHYIGSSGNTITSVSTDVTTGYTWSLSSNAIGIATHSASTVSVTAIPTNDLTITLTCSVIYEGITKIATKQIAILGSVPSAPKIIVNGMAVSLSTEAVGTTSIRYTLDGSDPTATTGTVYNGAIDLSSSTTSPITIKAVTVRNGYTSAVTTEVVALPLPAPVITTDGSAGTATISATEGATIYYTTDGSDPTTSSSLYSGSLSGLSPMTTIKAIAVKDGWNDSPVASETITIPSGVSGGTVTLFDYEDHTWTYYAGVDSSVDGGNYNSNYVGKLYSPNPRNVKITYSANGGAVSIDESETTFVYYKTLEESTTPGRYTYTVISNPFSKRPTGMGFGGWKIIRGAEYIDGYGANAVLPLDQEITFINLPYTSVNSTSAEIEFQATWVNYNNRTYANGNSFTYSVSGGTYETNFLVLNRNVTGTITVSSPCTIMMVEPDGSSDFRGNYTFTGNITPNNNGVTKIEFTRWNSTNTLNCNNHSVTVGRGMTTTSQCASYVTGVSGSTRNNNVTTYNSNLNYHLKLESGKFTDVSFLAGTEGTAGYVNCNGNSNQVKGTLGNDYDRAKGDDDKLLITDELFLGYRPTYANGNQNNATFKCWIKSGNLCTGTNVTNTTFNNQGAPNGGYYGDASQVFYVSVGGAQTNIGKRMVYVEGGILSGIAGGIDSNNGANNESFFLRMTGGQVRGVVYGSGAFAASSGIRRFIITGGTINGWVAAGCNGTDPSQSGGTLPSDTYVYVGGTSHIGNSTDLTLNTSSDGNVFGAGSGNSAQATTGQVNNSNVVIADQCYVKNNAYGGGNYGYSNATATVYVTGGEVEGSVFGGSNQKQGTTVIVNMTGGQVDKGVYGGSNVTGTISGNVTMNINGGQVGTTSQTANIHGGGYGQATRVSGNVDVTLGKSGQTEDGVVVYGDVYGGSALGYVNGTSATNTYHTYVTLNKGTIYGSLYGGALGDLASLGNAHSNVAANVYGPVQVKVYGGSVKKTSVAGSGGVYGANNINGAPQRAVTVDIYGTDPAPADNEYALYAVYGGGNAADYTYGNGYPTVTVHNCDNSIEYVYGGGNAAAVSATDVTIYGGNVIGNVFGGGNGESGTAANVNGNTNVKIYGGSILNVYGGSNSKGTIGGQINVTIDSQGETGGSACSMNIGNIYGGGNMAPSNAGNLNIVCTGDGGHIDNIFGGANQANVTGDINLKINGGDIGNVFGGNNQSGEISGNIEVTVGDNPNNCETFQIENVYGGGNLAAYGHGDNYPQVNITSGTITEGVYGGGYGESAVISGNPQVTVTGGTIGSVYGGGNAAAVEGKTVVSVENAAITNAIYGGSNAANISGTTTVDVISGTIGTGIYGGCNSEGTVSGDIAVNISGGTIGTSDAKANIHGGGYGSSTATSGNVTVNINGSIIHGDVYGGSALGNVNGSTSNTTLVNLSGGTIYGDAYGGGLGDSSNPAYVNGNVTVTLNGTAFVLTTTTDDEGNTIPASGRIFGCNNLNGTPKGTVLVKVLKTTPANGATRAKGTYEVQAVYGGGNLAAYDPTDPFAEGQFTEYTYSSVTAPHDNTDKPVQVVIDGCDETSIEYVYGGGNAAPTPATDVTVIGSYEIGNVFGGGNGKDKYTLDSGATWNNSNGADVGYLGSTRYGTGKSLASVFGGTVHYIFGGSNTKGNIRVISEAAIDEASDCPLDVEEIYGGGNEAYMEGDSKISLGCIDFLQEIYGGAKNANIGGDIVLTITSGHFDRVFGGNNLGGTIEGSITVNIEETGCNPITIGELYGCGNAAAYTTPSGKTDPTINIKSFTSIGRVFGGGLGEGAVVTGNPTVNINEVVGENASMTPTTVYAGTTRTLSDGTTVTLPDHTAGEIGAIGTVFGGGNAAAVNGNTNVYVGTEPTITYVSVDESSEPIPVVGVDIRGNVYGGGNAADVTGSTNVVIGQ